MTASSQGDRMKVDISRAREPEAHRDVAKNRAITQAKKAAGLTDLRWLSSVPHAEDCQPGARGFSISLRVGRRIGSDRGRDDLALRDDAGGGQRVQFFRRQAWARRKSSPPGSLPNYRRPGDRWQRFAEIRNDPRW